MLQPAASSPVSAAAPPQETSATLEAHSGASQLVGAWRPWQEAGGRLGGCAPLAQLRRPLAQYPVRSGQLSGSVVPGHLISASALIRQLTPSPEASTLSFHEREAPGCAEGFAEHIQSPVTEDRASIIHGVGRSIGCMRRCQLCQCPTHRDVQVAHRVGNMASRTLCGGFQAMQCPAPPPRAQLPGRAGSMGYRGARSPGTSSKGRS